MSKNNGDNFIDEDSVNFKINRTNFEAVHYTVYIASDIVEPQHYMKLYKVLDTALDTDFITIKLSSRGGDAQTMVRLINSIRGCKAQVHIKVVAPCYSAAAVMALCGDSLAMYPGTFLMFHNYSNESYGKGQELLDDVKRTDMWLTEFFSDCCYPFLTKAELRQISRDKDITVHYKDKDLQERIDRLYKHRSKK